MTRDDALTALFSPRAHERLQAARVLANAAKRDDLGSIRLALDNEHVPWVRSALEKLKLRLQGGKASPSDLNELLDPGERPPEASEITRSDLIGQVLHELTPAIGRLKMAAMSELQTYGGSRTEKEFERVAQLVDLFERWRRISAPPRSSAIDLHALLSDVADEEGASGVPIHVIAVENMPAIESDREFLRAAVANGVRNAVQAIEQKEKARSGEEAVTITYGITDRDFWISVNDDGVGLPGNAEYVFLSTTTTKPGHRGLGLPIALEAIAKLGGTVSLTPGARGGARFFVQVPIGEHR
jgi:signal transduction histidine kinase